MRCAQVFAERLFSDKQRYCPEDVLVCMKRRHSNETWFHLQNQKDGKVHDLFLSIAAEEITDFYIFSYNI